MAMLKKTLRSYEGSVMGDFEEGREMGLWGDDGVLYDLNDDSAGQDLNDIDHMKYSKENFRGMRETGSVKNTKNYTLAEYEYRDFRLETIAENLNLAISLLPSACLTYAPETF
jgi:hypothetical protein